MKFIYIIASRAWTVGINNILIKIIKPKTDWKLDNYIVMLIIFIPLTTFTMIFYNWILSENFICIK